MPMFPAGEARPVIRNRMRLTIVNQFYRPDHSPTAHLAASLAEHRARRGDQVTVIAGKGGYTGGGGASGEGAPGANPRVRRVWTPGLGKASHLKRVVDYAAFYLFAAWLLVTMRRQDVIIALTTPPLIAWAALLHKMLHPRAKLVLWNMDCYPDVAERAGVIKPGGLVARFVRGRTRAIFRGLDHLVCLDAAMAQLLCGQYAGSQPGLPVTIIPNWEDAAYFPKDAAYGASTLRGKLGLDGRFVVLYLGNMGYGHDFETVLGAAAALRDEPVSFVFVGGGKRYAEIEEAARARGLSNVRMHPYVPKEETGPAMKMADCALVTLRDDALGVMSPSKIHSNLALGLPLIYVGPPESNVDEAIRRFDCGMSLRHGQQGELVAFVRRMMSDRAAHESLRRRSREAFERAYCDAAAMPLFDAVLEHVTLARPASVRTHELVPAGDASRFARPAPAAAAAPAA